MILFDWGTYNGLSKLPIAAALGMRLTEVPPYDLARRKREEYFSRYSEYARRAFTLVTAHAPYYNVVSRYPEVKEASLKGLLNAVRRARAAGASIFNLHLGWRAYMDQRDVEEAADAIKKLAEEAGDGMIISVEVPYTPRMLGTWDEVRAIREAVGEDRVIVSVQLENAWMLETGASESGDFEGANRAATKEFWTEVLRRTLALSEAHLSLRFSQVIGFAIGRRILKKRVPLGRGYPDLGPLAEAIAEFLVKEVRGVEGLRAHLIYTGPPATKYVDTVALYAEIMRRAAKHL